MVKLNWGFQIHTYKENIYCSLCLILSKESAEHTPSNIVYTNPGQVFCICLADRIGQHLSSECCAGLCWWRLCQWAQGLSEFLASLTAVAWELQGDSFEKNHPLLKLDSKFSSFGVWILISELPYQKAHSVTSSARSVWLCWRKNACSKPAWQSSFITLSVTRRYQGTFNKRSAL